ncbi:MAG: chemotaxis protein CheW, partial [Promethearchaeota archaeon]
MKYVRAFMVIKKIKTYGIILKIFPDETTLNEDKFGNQFEIFLIVENADIVNIIKEELHSIAEIEEIIFRKVEILTKKEKEETNNKKKLKKKNLGENKDLSVQHIRVSINSLDNLINLIGELLISKMRLDKINQKYSIKELNESLTHINRVVFDLQDEVMQMRMIAVSHVFDIFPRMVRDLAKSMGKNVNFIMEGREIELDRTLLDEIGEPLVHLLRNAIDHGLETGDEREKAGKPRIGEIKLLAYRKRNFVIIEVSDDGNGIDFERFRDKSVAKGIITVKESQNMTINELKKILLKGGISTKSEVTEVSGRGVGMGIIRQKIDSMGGIIDIESEHRKGTRFIIKLPLTVAIIHSLLVGLTRVDTQFRNDQDEFEVKKIQTDEELHDIREIEQGEEKYEEIYKEIYAIPINNIIRSLVIKKKEIQTVNNKNVIYMFDKIIPLIELKEIVGFNASKDTDKSYGEFLESSYDNNDLCTIVIVENGETEFGLIVDELIGQQEIVIKSLGKFLKNTKGISGGTILGDGNVAIILDVGTIIE